MEIYRCPQCNSVIPKEYKDQGCGFCDCNFLYKDTLDNYIKEKERLLEFCYSCNGLLYLDQLYYIEGQYYCKHCRAEKNN